MIAMHQEELTQIFNDSYERVMSSTERQRNFFETFRQLLMSTLPEARDAFRNSDSEAQTRFLRALVGIFLLSSQPQINRADLRKVAMRYWESGIDIAPRLYPVWLECLIRAVQTFDVQFDEKVAEAWRETFAEGGHLMSRVRRTPL